MQPVWSHEGSFILFILVQLDLPVSEAVIHCEDNARLPQPVSVLFHTCDNVNVSNSDGFRWFVVYTEAWASIFIPAYTTGNAHCAVAISTTPSLIVLST